MLIDKCNLRNEDKTDVESFDTLQKLAEENYEDARGWFTKIDCNNFKRIALKRIGINLNEIEE